MTTINYDWGDNLYTIIAPDTTYIGDYRHARLWLRGDGIAAGRVRAILLLTKGRAIFGLPPLVIT